MKKIFLLCALIGAGQIYGMESVKQWGSNLIQYYWYGNPQPELMEPKKRSEEMNPTLWGKSVDEGGLPDDVKHLIILAFAQSGNNIDKAIKNIKIASLTNKALNKMINADDLQGFTQIVHVLADKFDEKVGEIASELKTETAKKYIELNDELLTAVLYNDNSPETFKKITQLIKDGADVNYVNGNGGWSILGGAMFNLEHLGNKTSEVNTAIIQLLLESGLKPTDKVLDNIEWLRDLFPENVNIKNIEQLINQAMQK